MTAIKKETLLATARAAQALLGTGALPDDRLTRMRDGKVSAQDLLAVGNALRAQDLLLGSATMTPTQSQAWHRPQLEALLKALTAQKHEEGTRDYVLETLRDALGK